MTVGTASGHDSGLGLRYSSTRSRGLTCGILGPCIKVICIQVPNCKHKAGVWYFWLGAVATWVGQASCSRLSSAGVGLTHIVNLTLSLAASICLPWSQSNPTPNPNPNHSPPSAYPGPNKGPLDTAMSHATALPVLTSTIQSKPFCLRVLAPKYSQP